MVIWLLLSGCVRPDDTGVAFDLAVDADRDGYAAAEDCRDDDPSISPAAPELCNGWDDDCDQQIDEHALDASTWYADGDGDGWGDEPTTACDAPSGHVERDGDCDDADAHRHPDAEETCDGIDEDCDGQIDDGVEGASTWYLDADGDGYGSADHADSDCDGIVPAGWVSSTDFDCDDTRADVSPAGVETCDEVDEDCDGLVDEEAIDTPTWYPDEDDDGFGAADAATSACSIDGWIQVGDDCDDGQAEVHPDATEVCNDVDDDGDGAVDVDDDDVVDSERLYDDADGDGFGAGEPSQQCPGEGLVDVGGDCEAQNAAVHPDATEDCYDGIDNDCDGDVDADDDDLDATTWYLDLDGDGYGANGSGEASCDEPSGSVVVTGDCNDRDADIHPGGSEVCGDGIDNDCSGDDNGLCLGGSVADAELVVTGSVANSYLGGHAVAADRDGDGTLEAVVGANGETGSRGAVYVFDATATGTATTTDALASWTGWASSEYFGASLAAHDIDGDGADELAVGATGSDLGAEGGGIVVLLDDDAASGAGATEATASWSGLYDWTVGNALAFADDLDGDGAADLVIGGGVVDWSASGSGAVFVTPAETVGNATLGGDTVLYGASASDYFGVAVATVGDMDGDGLDDLAVGASGQDDGGNGAGAAYVFFGPLTAGSTDAADADAFLWGEGRSDQAGTALAGLGDHDGDGYGDLVVGAYQAGDGGRAYVVSGPPSDLDLGLSDCVLEAAGSGDYFGLHVAPVGDVDGDGADDLGVGSRYNDDGGSYSGSAHVFVDPLIGTLEARDAIQLTGAASDDQLWAITGLGDVDADGFDDLLLGAVYADDTASNVGAAYVVLGGLGI